MKDKIAAIIIMVVAIAIAVWLIFFSTGCATAIPNKSFADSWDSAKCQQLLNQKDALVWVTALSSGLSGLGGVTTASSDDSKVRLGVGITTAVMGVLASSLIVLSKVKNQEFEQYCNIEFIEIPDGETEYSYQIKDGGV
jgi:ABC-type uncharacterized transport system permease subunit